MTYLILVLFGLILGISLSSGDWWLVPASIGIAVSCAAATAGLVYIVPRQRQIASVVRAFWHDSRIILVILMVGLVFLALGIIWKGVISGG